MSEAATPGSCRCSTAAGLPCLSAIVLAVWRFLKPIEVDTGDPLLDLAIALDSMIPVGACARCGAETIWCRTPGELCKACGGRALRPIPTTEYVI